MATIGILDNSPDIIEAVTDDLKNFQGEELSQATRAKVDRILNAVSLTQVRFSVSISEFILTSPSKTNFHMRQPKHQFSFSHGTRPIGVSSPRMQTITMQQRLR
jgi:hypothetical protein